MDVSRRVGVRCSVVAGSVWERRMKSDEFEGGVKVFSGEQSVEEGSNGDIRFKRGQIGGVVNTGKRKTWKSERSEGLDNKKIQIARGKTEPQKNSSSSSQQCKDLNISSDSIKKISIHTRKKRSEVGEYGQRNVGQLRKNKLDSIKNVADGNEGNAMQLRKDKSELGHHVLDESMNGMDELVGESGRIVIHNGKNDSDANCKDFGVCQEVISSRNSDYAGMVECSSMHVDGDYDDEEDEEKVDDEEIDIEMEKVSFDVKEISAPESKVVNEPERKEVVNVPEKQKNESEPESKKVVSTKRKFHQKNERPVSVPIIVKQSPPIRKHSSIHQNFSKADSILKTEEYCSFPQSQNKLQSLVDLIMWRDISRSAFIFGIGTFTIVSSSYAKDINLSLISVMSYIGLVYLAAIFLYRSLICRGVIDIDTNYVLGEEEAIWVLKLILPYLNEFLLKFRAMFSGDPGTTMKLAVLLFALARCGSSITIWKMAKFGFFGVFTLPKIFSLYSAQLTAYVLGPFLTSIGLIFRANFWIRRFRDAWDSCSHKKAVALGIFSLVWNLSSVVARIWSVFVLFVAFRYYQQHYLVRDEWVEDEAGCDESWQEPVGVKVGMQRQRQTPNLTHKVKKGF